MLFMNRLRPLWSLVAAAVICSTILLAYSNTLHSPWIFDDTPNILQNPTLHIDNLQPATLWSTFFAEPRDPGKMYRPIPCFTFAINWYFSQTDTTGYHVVNIIIHCLCALVLYGTVILLLSIPFFDGRFTTRQKQLVALATALLWGLHPVQIQAVTYIVQRMTSLAALFFLCAFYFYLRFRLRHGFSFLVLALSLGFYLLAMLSKENTFIFPLSVLLAEFCFFRNASDKTSKIIRYSISVCVALVVGYALYYFSISYSFNTFFSPLHHTPFSIYQRLISQPSVILFYISLLLFPHHGRFSISHDMVLQDSFFEPTVLLSTASIGLLVTGSLILIRKAPLLSFGILFYFVNHLVESSVIPLEPVFEHRNYLPSFFFFLPLTTFVVEAIYKYKKTKPDFSTMVAVGTVMCLAALGWNTYQRNIVWKTKLSLWEDARQNAPNNARPWAKIGQIKGYDQHQSQKKFTESITSFSTALTKKVQRQSFYERIFGDMGEISYRYGRYDMAIPYFQKSLTYNPKRATSQYGLAKSLMASGQFDKTVKATEKGINILPDTKRLYTVQGSAYLWLDKPQDAVASFSRVVESPHANRMDIFNLGVALSKSGQYQKAEKTLLQSRGADDFLLLMALIENSLSSDDDEKLEHYSGLLVKHFPENFIKARLKFYTNEYRSLPFATQRIEEAVFIP